MAEFGDARLPERFWSKVRASNDECWEWTASRFQGYGQYWDGSSDRRAHRIAYKTLVGPIPDGFQLDCLCQNLACVNPSHMEPTTTTGPSEGTRICSTCGVEKPLPDGFHRDKRRLSGFRARCKSCHDADVAQRQSEGQARESRRKRDVRYRAKYPERTAAKDAVQRAVRRGELIKPAGCEHCGKEARLHGHHRDYSKPLEVIWLCSPCHGQEHAHERGWTQHLRAAGEGEAGDG